MAKKKKDSGKKKVSKKVSSLSLEEKVEERAELFRILGYEEPKKIQTKKTKVMVQPSLAMIAAQEAELAEQPPLTLERMEELEAMLEVNPEETLAKLREAWDTELTESQLRSAFAEARHALQTPEAHVPALRAMKTLAASTLGLPDGFTFPGMDLAKIPIEPNNRKFEEIGDALGWVLFGAWPALFPSEKAPFRKAESSSSKFDYTLEEPSAGTPLEIALFSDFGTGLYHSRT